MYHVNQDSAHLFMCACIQQSVLIYLETSTLHKYISYLHRVPVSVLEKTDTWPKASMQAGNKWGAHDSGVYNVSTQNLLITDVENSRILSKTVRVPLFRPKPLQSSDRCSSMMALAELKRLHKGENMD